MIEPEIRAEGVPVPLDEGTIVLEEARHYTVHVDGAGAASLGALELPRSDQGGFALWSDHSVGASYLRVVVGSEQGRWPVRLIPRAEKLSPALWLDLVAEVEAWFAGASVGLGGARHGSVDTQGRSLPLLVEALLPLVPAFEQAVRALVRDPRKRQASEQVDVRLHQARRVDRETLTWVMRHSDVARWLLPWRRAEFSGPEPLVPQRKAHDTLDHPANRYVAWLVFRVSRLLDGAGAALAHLGTGTDPAAPWCQVRAERLQAAADRLRGLLRRSFLSDLPRQPASEAALLVVLDDPLYARVHRIGRRFLSPMFQLEDGPHQAATVPSYTMYELWCLAEVGRQLEALLTDGWHWKWTGRAGLLKPGGTGANACLTGQHPTGTLRLCFNPTFPGYFNRSGPRWSLSSERRPDLVATWQPEHAQGHAAWVCLDAKYRAGRTNLGDAFTSVHVYRDALRDDAHGGPPRAVCLLAPAASPDTAAWFSPEFRAEHGCGIWELRPSADRTAALGEWIASQLLHPQISPS